MSRLVVGVLAAVAAVVLVGALFRLFDSASAPPIVIADPPGPEEIVVAVEGAVATPGLYRLPGDARHGDAIAAAGGLAGDADQALVNPARRLYDEDRLVVPSRAPVETAAPAAATRDDAAAESTTISGDRDDDDPSPTEPPLAPIAVTASNGGGGPSPIDINAASAAELDALPGIGPALAERIVGLRSERGAFRSVEELEQVEGISPRMVEEIRPLVSLGG